MKRILTALTLTGLVLGATACETTTDPNLTVPTGGTATTKAGKKRAADGSRKVTYRISGTASAAMITYTTPSGQEQDTQKLPWTKSMRAKAGEFLSINAQIQDDGGGSVTCTIAIDGKVTKRATSRGAYAIASCDTMLGF